jgi:CRP-like cAMP-binding protein
MKGLPEKCPSSLGLGKRLSADEIAALRQAVIFRDVREEDLHPLAEVGERRTYGRGAIIEVPDDGSDVIFIVVRGEARVYLLSSEGREITLFTRQPGGIFDLKELGEELSDYAVAEAMVSETVVYTIQWSYVLELVAFDLGAVGSLAALLREGMLQHQRLISELAFYNTRSRLAHKLADLADRDPAHIVTTPREELAAMIGTRPEEVSRALRDLLEEGLVFYRLHGRAIGVLDPVRLAEY